MFCVSDWKTASCVEILPAAITSPPQHHHHLSYTSTTTHCSLPQPTSHLHSPPAQSTLPAEPHHGERRAAAGARDEEANTEVLLSTYTAEYMKARTWGIRSKRNHEWRWCGKRQECRRKSRSRSWEAQVQSEVVRAWAQSKGLRWVSYILATTTGLSSIWSHRPT